jgi:hypothetical protein
MILDLARNVVFKLLQISPWFGFRSSNNDSSTKRENILLFLKHNAKSNKNVICIFL